LINEPTQPLRIPFVREYSQSDKTLLEYEKAVFQAQGALNGPDVDTLLDQNEKRFLASAAEYHSRQPSRVIDAAEPPPNTSKKQRAPRKSSAREVYLPNSRPRMCLENKNYLTLTDGTKTSKKIHS
jgi:hypothetical protein